MAKSARRTGRVRKASASKKAVRRSSRERGTDWRRVEAMTDEEIERNVAADPDAAPIFTDEMLARARWIPPLKKTPISFRVDPDILQYFKSKGPG